MSVEALRDHQVDLVSVADVLHEHLDVALVRSAFETLRDGERERAWTLKRMVECPIGFEPTRVPFAALRGRASEPTRVSLGSCGDCQVPRRFPTGSPISVPTERSASSTWTASC